MNDYVVNILDKSLDDERSRAGAIGRNISAPLETLNRRASALYPWHNVIVMSLYYLLPYQFIF